VYFRPADIAIAANSDGEPEGRVENLRRTPAGVRATIALGDTAPLCLVKS
jgi:sulfate/thiosulfate transport system ATP-binding protein